MKNIHVLPTDKPSRLWVNNLRRRLELDKDVLIGSNTAQHIYITSDEEIKEGDWLFSTITNNLFKADSIEYLESHNMIEDFDKSFYINSKYAKKIILTTDQPLDGVQAIDDEFLEWFVKNPSCEEVSVERYGYMPDEPYEYKIIIPKKESIHCDCGFSFDVCSKRTCPNEEPKQETVGKQFYENADMVISVIRNKETLEEATILAWDLYEHTEGHLYSTTFKNAFKLGANWKAERMYSEEDIRLAINKARDISDGKDCFDAEDISGCTEVCTYGWKFNMSEDSIIEQFKKK